MGKHYVPQKYLQGFAVPENSNLIWMYDKQEKLWSRPAIKQVAQQRDYFPEDIEKRLTAEIENPGNVALQRLRNGEQITSRDRNALAIYIAVMIMRVPRRRRRGYERVPGVLDNTMRRMREEVTGGAALDSEKVPELLAEIDRIESEYRKKVPSSIVEQIRSPWASENVINAVGSMTWRLVTAPASSFFLTTDNPAFFFEAFGVGSQNAELTFPVSSTVALLGSYQGVPGATIDIQPKPVLVKEINRRLVSGSERFVFSHKRASWIEVLASKDSPYLNRIIW